MKKSVNLIIKSGIESPLIHHLKIILPLAAVSGIILFIITFIASFIYIKSNLQDYDLLKNEVSTLESKIDLQKKLEGVYTIATTKLYALEQILSQKKSYIGVLSDIDTLQKGSVDISSVRIDSDNNISFSAVASSAAQLDEFINLLLTKEQKKQYSNIQVSQFMKDKKDRYKFSISMKSDPVLLR